MPGWYKKAQHGGLTLYHSTWRQFDRFDVSGKFGIHLGNEEQAKKRASDVQKGTSQDVQDKRQGNDPVVMAVNARINNPLRMQDLNWNRPDQIARALMGNDQFSHAANEKGIYDSGAMDQDTLRSMGVYGDPGKALAELRRLIEMAGFDGVVYENKIEGKGDSYIAFSPDQVEVIGSAKP